MLKTNLKPHDEVVDFRKAKCGIAFAFLLFFAASAARAQTNWVSGTAYGTNDLSANTSIASVQDGEGSLIIGYADTTNLSLNHAIGGDITITNQAAVFTITATSNAVIRGSEKAVLLVENAPDLSISGGRFLGTLDTSGGPPTPGVDGTSVGGILRNSTATIAGSEFAGSAGNAGMIIEASDLTVSNAVFRGGEGATGGAGLAAFSNSVVTIQSGSFTGAVGSTALYLQNSDATVQDGSFVGNVNGSSQVAGDGLFSRQTTATTNSVSLHGGSFSSVAFYGTENSLLNVLTGTNLVIQYGIIQSNGTVIVDNQGDSALQDINIFDGTMQMLNDFTLSSNGVFALMTANSSGGFSSNLYLDTGSALHVGLGRIDVAGNFTQSAGSNLYFVINTETNGLLTANAASFQSNATINIDATAAGYTYGTNEVVLVATVTGITGTNNIAVNANAAGRVYYDSFYLAGGNDLVFRFISQSLSNYWSATGQLGLLAGELDASGNTAMLNTIDAYNDPTLSSMAIEQTYFTTFNNFQTALQGLRAAVGQSISRSSEFRDQLKLIPPGAKGPERNNQLRGWAKYYGQYVTRDEEQLVPSYDTTLHGGVVGIDTSLGNLLVGISGGSGRYRISYDGSSAKSDTEAYHGNVYGTYGMERGYVDFGAAYGQNKVETRTADPFRLNGEFDAEIAGAYLGGGYDLIDSFGGTIFTPEAAIHYTTYEQDGYTEEGTAAVPRVIDAFDADSLLSSLGMNVSMLNEDTKRSFGYKADLRLHWLHEFNADPSNMNFMLQGGANRYAIAYPALDEDIYRVGIGATFFNTLKHQPQNVLLRIDFDELFGEGFNSHNLSAKVIYAF